MKKSKINIQILGQPMYNVGDLAACKTLVNVLNENIQCEVSLMFQKNEIIDPEFLAIKNVQISNELPNANRLEKIATILNPIFLKWLLFFPSIKKKYKKLNDADFIIFAPGGLELGLYKSWKSLWFLAVGIALGKNFGIYSRSIGDFRNRTLSDLIFRKLTINYLRKSKYNGLRDLKSQQIASYLNIPYVPSIDVVYTSLPNLEVSSTIKENIGSDYTVFTPSNFDWHQRLKTIPTDQLKEAYLKIINTLLEKTSGKVVMLPHIYKEDKDSNYFNDIKLSCNNSSRILIFKRTVDPDVYNAIIRNSALTIAARSHQVIFAVNNKTPFICLSYEHKMENMLEILELKKYSITINQLVGNEGNIEELIENALVEKDQFIDNLQKAQFKARSIAVSSLNDFISRISTSN